MTSILDYLQRTRVYAAAAELRHRLATSPLSSLVEIRVFAALAALTVAVSVGWLLFKHPGSAPEVLSFIILVAVVGWLVWPRTEIREN